MRGSLDDSLRARLETVVVRTTDAVERTQRILESARDPVILSGAWPSAARHTRRNTVASLPRWPRVWPAYLVDQAPDTSSRLPRSSASIEARPGAGPPALDPSILHELIAGLLARAARLAERSTDVAVHARVAIAEAAARDARHWLLDEPWHTPESLLAIEASVHAIAKALAAIEDAT